MVVEPLFSDLTLARRLELAEGYSAAGAIDARAAVVPGSGAAWREVGGVLALFDGVDSPLTQTFGLGVSGPVEQAGLDALERFFLERDAKVLHEVSPLAGPPVLALLNARGYRPVEWTNVVVKAIGGAEPANATSPIRVRLLRSSGHDEWAEIAARGWSEVPEAARMMRDLGPLLPLWRHAHCFLAELDGVPIATGLLTTREDVALLAGASTVPEGRHRGAQLALLGARLRHARECGCTVAMMGTLPGSTSQRNAERQGFRVAYTRTKWRLGP